MNNKGGVKAIDDKWHAMGRSFGEVIKIIYIYMGIAAVLIIITAAALIAYRCKAKKQKENGIGTKSNKKFLAGRIGITVLVGALVLLISPIVMGLFL